MTIQTAMLPKHFFWKLPDCCIFFSKLLMPPTPALDVRSSRYKSRHLIVISSWRLPQPAVISDHFAHEQKLQSNCSSHINHPTYHLEKKTSDESTDGPSDRPSDKPLSLGDRLSCSTRSLHGKVVCFTKALPPKYDTLMATCSDKPFLWRQTTQPAHCLHQKTSQQKGVKIWARLLCWGVSRTKMSPIVARRLQKHIVKFKWLIRVRFYCFLLGSFSDTGNLNRPTRIFFSRKTACVDLLMVCTSALVSIYPFGHFACATAGIAELVAAGRNGPCSAPNTNFHRQCRTSTPMSNELSKIFPPFFCSNTISF